MIKRRYPTLATGLALACLAAFAWASSSVESGSMEGHMVRGEHMSPDEHAAHRAAMAATGYSVSTETYDIPDVRLVDDNGAPVALRSMLEADHPVVLNFIFTTCTTICPVMSATFAQMRSELGDSAQDVQLVSISIDPGYDRPETLRKYAERFHAGSGWSFLTGDDNDISRVVLSFRAYDGSKMNHKPVTFMKKPHEDSWVRIDGLASGKDLAHEVTERLLN